MTEERFKYDVGSEQVGLQFANRGSDDFRLQVLDDLGLPELDEAYVAVLQNWQTLRAEWVEAKVKLDAAKQKLAQREAEVRKATPPEAYKASSGPERKAKFDNIVAADVEVQEVQAQVLTCRWGCDSIARSIEDAEKELSHIKTRLNWRTFVLRFMGTVKPVSGQQMAL